MKVVLATGIYPPDIGGPATYVSNLAPALLGRGHAVEVVSYGTARAPEDGIPVRRVRRTPPLPLRYAAYYRAVRRAAHGADVVFLQDPLSSGLPGLAAARSRGVPALLKVVGDVAWEVCDEAGWIEGGVSEFQHRRYGPRVEAVRAAVHAVARRADRVVVPARHLAEMLRAWGVRDDRLHVVPNAVPPAASSSSREEARRAFGLGSGLVIVSAGRLLPYKGFDVLIDAAAAVGAPAPTVVIAGEGPGREALAIHARELGLQDALRMPGALPRRELSRLLAAADVFALLSSHEGRSHVLLEAMQAGLPIVASDVPGNRELLRDGRDALLVPREGAAVAEVLRRLAGSPDLRARLGAEARGVGARGWDEMLASTLEVLERTRQRR